MASTDLKCGCAYWKLKLLCHWKDRIKAMMDARFGLVFEWSTDLKEEQTERRRLCQQVSECVDKVFAELVTLECSSCGKVDKFVDHPGDVLSTEPCTAVNCHQRSKGSSFDLMFQPEVDCQQVAFFARQAPIVKANIASSSVTADKWYIDSATSRHMCKTRQVFTNYDHLSEPIPILAANGQLLEATGTGTVKLETESALITMKDVEYVNGLDSNLFSVRQATKYGNTVIFKGNTCRMFNQKNQCVINAYAGTDGLYAINMAKSTQKANCVKQSFAVDGTNQRKLTKAIRPSDLVHIDLCSSFVPSHDGCRFILTCVDDFTGHCAVYFLDYRGEATRFLKIYLRKMAEKGFTIGCVRMSVNLNFCRRAVGSILRKFDINFEQTTSKLKGVAELKNEALQTEMNRLLRQSGMSAVFWCEALNYANYVMNRKTSTSGPSPYEKMFGQRPEQNYFHDFGRKCSVLNGSCWDTNAIFLGYTVDDDYRVKLQGGKSIHVEACDIKFGGEVSPHCLSGSIRNIPSYSIGDPRKDYWYYDSYLTDSEDELVPELVVPSRTVERDSGVCDMSVNITLDHSMASTSGQSVPNVIEQVLSDPLESEHQKDTVDSSINYEDAKMESEDPTLPRRSKRKRMDRNTPFKLKRSKSRKAFLARHVPRLSPMTMWSCLPDTRRPAVWIPTWWIGRIDSLQISLFGHRAMVQPRTC